MSNEDQKIFEGIKEKIKQNLVKDDKDKSKLKDRISE